MLSRLDLLSLSDRWSRRGRGGRSLSNRPRLRGLHVVTDHVQVAELVDDGGDRTEGEDLPRLELSDRQERWWCHRER